VKKKLKRGESHPWSGNYIRHYHISMIKVKMKVMMELGQLGPFSVHFVHRRKFK
jgi:hypothetical protein